MTGGWRDKYIFNFPMYTNDFAQLPIVFQSFNELRERQFEWIHQHKHAIRHPNVKLPDGVFMCGKYVVAQEKLKSSQQTGALPDSSGEAFSFDYNGLHHIYTNDSCEHIAPPSSWAYDKTNTSTSHRSKASDFCKLQNITSRI